jgi:zinc protease
MDLVKNTERIRLPNGLTLLLHPMQNSRAAALHFCVQAGYFCETDSEVGLAHLLEHMYFKGSEKFPVPGTMGIRLKALGGTINASTSYDQTNYFCEVPSENLIPAFMIMADAFTAPLFPEDELKKECEVVIEEFNRKLDNPSAYSQEMLIRLAFREHRMKRWRIGTPEQLRSYTRDHLFDYFHRYYQPQNMVIAVAGNFDSAEVLKTVEMLFHQMTGRPLVKDFGPSEPSQNEFRYFTADTTATQSYLHFGFHAPGVLHPDEPLLEFLAFLLSGGRSARLHRHVVERKRSASSASFYFLAYEDAGLLMLSAVTDAEKIREAASDCWSVIQDLRENGITTEELQKVKNRLRLYQAMQAEEALNVAEILSYYEAYGSYHRIEEHLNRMQQIKKEEIIETASRYLQLDGLSVMEYVNSTLPILSPEDYRRHLKDGFVLPETTLAQVFPSESKPVNTNLQTSELPIIRQGHATYIFHPDTHHPFIAAGIFFRGGRNEENDTTAGITHLMHRAALKGTTNFSAAELASRFDSLGNSPRFSCYRDFSGFQMEALPEFFPDMWNLLIHCILDAQFPAAEIETEKGKVLSSIRRNMDDNFVRPAQLFHHAFYGKGHPYGLPETGFEETVLSLNPEDLETWKQRLWSGNRAIITVVGSFDPDQLFEEMEKGISKLSDLVAEITVPPQARTPAGEMNLEIRPKKQTAFILGFPAPPASSAVSVRFDVLQQILSGMGGRLFLNLRSKKALAYTVHAATISSLHGGAFVTYIAGEASKEEQALEAMWHELESLKRDPVDPVELENARNALIGNYTLNTQTASSRVMDYVHSHILGREIPYAGVYKDLVQRVGAAELQHIAQETFLKEISTIGIVRGTGDTSDREGWIAAS